MRRNRHARNYHRSIDEGENYITLDSIKKALEQEAMNASKQNLDSTNTQLNPNADSNNLQNPNLNADSNKTQNLDSINGVGDFPNIESNNSQNLNANSKNDVNDFPNADSINVAKDSNNLQNLNNTDSNNLQNLDSISGDGDFHNIDSKNTQNLNAISIKTHKPPKITKDKIAQKLLDSNIVFVPKNEHWKKHNQKVLSIVYMNILGLSHVREHNFEEIFGANFIKNFENMFSSESVAALSKLYSEYIFPPFVEKNFAMLQNMLKFSKEECFILHYFYLLRSDCIVYPNEIELEMHAKIIASQHNLSTKAVQKILQNDRNKLITSGFIDDDYLLESRWEGAFERDKSVFFLNLVTQKRFFEKYGYKPKPTTLSVEDFSYMGEKFSTIMHTASRLKSGNILLYGSPGVGKNEIVNVIAKALNKEIICVENKRQTRHNDEDYNNRILAFQALQSAARSEKHIICFDECEDSLCYNSLHQKARINCALENTRVLNFFLSNSKQMDGAYLRRFDLVMEIKTPPKNKKISMVKAVLDSKISLDSKLLEQVALNPNLTQGIILSAAKLASIFPKSKAQAIFLKYINENLRARELSPIRLLKADSKKKEKTLPYDMSLIECDVDIVEYANNIKKLLPLAKKTALDSKDSDSKDSKKVVILSLTMILKC
ncbi:AAA domain-containing protein [Helicobacter saguini]|uniref:AAA domain-containing protein n=1 Tax=Helicobacter saguini TaxID=1548018 RepID=A0A347VQP4_9HELI|nr:AAA family ATPase [Helicobacter saguini]MWV63213.1 AAA domain-containing protein [Helicobacter saguini]MWV66118.1 AAA domain-containing protein [Helicobacter saguini]MWV68468.1 AAA domain-containing protein [Helicobacter saguini]MWV71978.1 AAA domain-containing protein [Helicobacter saguini]TLD95985.1 AAA family ATPase [Helicobacter saguini]